MTPDLSYYWEGAREECEDKKWGGATTTKKVVAYQKAAQAGATQDTHSRDLTHNYA